MSLTLTQSAFNNQSHRWDSMHRDGLQEPPVHFSKRLCVTALAAKHRHAWKVVKSDGDFPSSGLKLCVGSYRQRNEKDDETERGTVHSVSQ